MAKKPTLTDVSSGYASGTTLNANFQALADAFDNTLSRDGSTPNQMQADIDLNSNNLTNAGTVFTNSLYLNGFAVTTEVQAEIANRPEDFGADVAAADNTTALNAWLAAGAAGLTLGGRGTYNFTGVLTLAACDFFTLFANGITLNYTGVDTTGTKIVFGESGAESTRWLIDGLRVSSSTTMTADHFILIERVMRSRFEGFRVDGLDGNGNLYQGAWIKDCGFVNFDNYEFRGSNKGAILSGTPGKGQAEYRFRDGRFYGATIGLHIGGGVGGVYVDGDFTQNGEHIRIDRTISDNINREFFFTANTIFDESTANGVCVNIQDVTTTTDNFYLNFDGTWVASTDNHGIFIASGAYCTIQMTGGKIFNMGQVHGGTGNGITNESANSTIILSDVFVEDNTGTGLNLTTAPLKYEAKGIVFRNNGTDFSSNGRPADFYQSNKRYGANMPQAFGAVGDYDTDDAAAIQAWVTSWDGEPLWIPAGNYRILNSRISLPEGIIIRGPGGTDIQPYPQRNAEKEKLRPTFKNTLKGANLIFDGTPAQTAITTLRNDSRTGLQPCINYVGYSPCQLSGFSILQDMDVLDAGGSLTTAATDNRSSGYNCGVVNRGYNISLKDITIFGYFPQGGFINLTVFADGRADPDYARLDNCNITSGVVILGAHDALKITTTGNVTVGAGETITQPSNPGASGVVVNAVSNDNEIFLYQTSSTDFDLVNELTGSVTGGLGANSVPTDLDKGDGGNTGLKADGCNIYGSDHHNRDDTDPDVPTVFIDGDTGGTNQGVRANSFSNCALRTYANIAMDFGDCTYVGFEQTSFEFSTRAGITGLDATGRPRGTAGTKVIEFGLGANTSGFDLQTFAGEITGPIFDRGTGGATEGFRVIKGGAGTPANVSAAVMTIAGAGDPRFQLTNDVSTSSNDWCMDMDVDDSNTFKWRYDGTEVQEMSSDGVFGKLALTSGPELTIAGGVITPTNTRSRFSVDTEGNATSDDLDTITATYDGHMIILRSQSISRTVVLKDGTGNLELNGDFTLDNTRNRICLMYESAFGDWIEMWRSDNAA